MPTLGFVLSAMTLFVLIPQNSMVQDGISFTIRDTGNPIPFDLNDTPVHGAEVGGIIENHYYMALKYYQGGRYREAYNDFTYMINRVTYINGNPNQSQIMTACYYLRGRVLLYYAEGSGRLVLARNDFETAIKWNPKNYLAYLELSRVFVAVEMKSEAISLLQHLLELKPDPDVAAEAERDLASL